jgi:D-amino-acid dehydrogenase
MDQRADVLVIGGGVIGVCAAYYLQQEGRRVVLLDKDEICSGSSHGNAGWLVPSHSVPLARPGAILNGLRWMLRPESPFYVKPRLSLELIAWLWRFRAAANERTVRRSLPVACELSKASLELYEELITKEELDCYYEQRGLIALYATEQGLEEGVEEGHLLREHGISSQELNSAQVTAMEPAVRSDVAGGIYHDGDAHLKPDDLVHGLAARFQAQGGVIHTGTEVLGFELAGDTIASVKTDKGDYPARQVVLAAGAWSPWVVRALKLKLPVQPAKGYSITFDEPVDPPSMPVMLAEARIGVTPMGPVLRFAGTLELSGLNTDIDRRRVEAIRRAGHRYLATDLSASPETVWCGMRPLTPDNLPIIGAVDRPSNLIVATGHSMTGVTLGSVTGKLVAQLVTEQDPIVDPAPFSPMRFR